MGPERRHRKTQTQKDTGRIRNSSCKWGSIRVLRCCTDRSSNISTRHNPRDRRRIRRFRKVRKALGVVSLDVVSLDVVDQQRSAGISSASDRVTA